MKFDINKIIRKVLKEQGEEPIFKDAPIKVKGPNVFGNVLTFKDPVGNGFILPEKMLVSSPKIYDKQAWIDWYSDLSNARKHFQLVLKNKDTSYKKLCHDAQLKQIITTFLQVRDNWIPENLEVNKYNFDDLIINDMQGLQSFYETNKKTYLSDFAKELKLPASKKQIFDGTDYFFLLLNEWIKTTDLNGAIEFEKGNFQNHANPIEKETVSFGDKYVIRWDWGIKKSEFCDTVGQWQTWYEVQGQFVKQLYENSVYSFDIDKNKFLEWSKLFNYDIKNLGNSTSNVITFRACHKQIEQGVREFSGYYSDSVEVNNENLEKGKVWQCYGIKFPGNGDILGLTKQRDITQEEGWFSDAEYVSGTLVDIPLQQLDIHYDGEWYKQFVDYSDENPSNPLNALNPGYWLAKAFGLEGLVTGESYKNHIEIPQETPLALWTGNEMFKEEDFIAHTKITEESEIWTIPENGLSYAIPGAKKDSQGKYYIKYKAGENQLVLYLPPPEWWNDYYLLTYKIRNKVSTGWNFTEKPVFGLVLTIADAQNLSLVIDTKGAEGWSFKLNQNGQMFFYIRGEQKNYNDDYYFPVNGFLSPYNFTDIEQFDSRSDFGTFMESWWGIGVQVIIGIALATVCAPLAAGLGAEFLLSRGLLAADSSGAISWVAKFLVEEGIFTVARIEVYFAILYEVGVLGIPMAAYYKSRNDDFGVWLSIICCFLPLALETKAFMGFSNKLWSKTLGNSLSRKILAKGSSYFRKNMSLQSLMDFVNTLSAREAMAFGELIRGFSEYGEQGVKEIISNAEARITKLTLENSEKLKAIMPGIRKTIEMGGLNLLVVGGGMFITIPMAKVVYDYYTKKGVKLTPEQQKNLQKGMENMANYIKSHYDETVLEKIRQDLKDSELGLILPSAQEWSQDFLKANEDIFNQMCEENGWEKLKSDPVKNPKNQYQKDLQDAFTKNGEELSKYLSKELIDIAKLLGVNILGIKFDITSVEDITVNKDTNFDYKMSKGLLYKKSKKETDKWQQITDETEIKTVTDKYFKDLLVQKTKEIEFSDSLPLIYKQFPCLEPSKLNFEFMGGEKDPFFATFKILNGDYKDKEIYVIPNYDTDENETDYTITTNDNNGYIMYFVDEIKKSYSC